MSSPLRQYWYVGPDEIRINAGGLQSGAAILSVDGLQAWLEAERVRLAESEPITVTFVVDREGRLRIASRHSEHVACAGGEPVLSAGEMTFALDGNHVVVEEVTNQSTGYCPEPESWPAVADALGRAGIPGPGSFTREYHFRRCPDCAAINLVKDEVFECAVCATELPLNWNLGTTEP